MPCEETLDQFSGCWEGLEDPRSGNAGLHDFHELLVIALCTVLCGGQGAVDMALFAEAKEPFLRGFLKLKNGLPSQDTCSRLFRNLDPDQFRASLQRFMAQFSSHCQGFVAMDGKVLRRSFDRASGKSALHRVSAWGCEQRLVLAQIATDAKSNEITAVPKLLQMLALKGTIVTADALNCQRTIAQQIVDQGGDYALALKGREPGHAARRCQTLSRRPGVRGHRGPARGRGLTAIGKVERKRETPDKTTTETAYYLLSAAFSAERFNQIVRQHWEVENRLHWRLDVVINEDQDRTRLGNGPHNLAVLRHMALNAMQKQGSKGSLRGKFKRAGWDDSFLTSLLAIF